MPTYG